MVRQTGRIVPDGWAARYRPIVAAFFHDTVTIRRQTGWTEDELGTRIRQWSMLTPAEGVRAQVQVRHTASVEALDSAGRPIVVTDYMARLDLEWLPDAGDVVEVTASPDPANLGLYVVRRRESQTHVADRTVLLDRTDADTIDGIDPGNV